MDEESDPAADLAKLVADTRQIDASRGRARERVLRQQAAEEATLRGVLLDLAEAGEDVTISVTSGRTLQGSLSVVGLDFLAVRTPAGAESVVPVAEIGAIRRRPNARPTEPSGARLATPGPSLAAYLGALAPERPRVGIVVRGESSPLNGELRASGLDVLTVQLDGAPPVTAYVPLPSISVLAIWVG